jgi:hypothetical protein
MSNIFGAKYPIVCAPMYQISDANLAVAVYNAGCFPGFIMPTFGFDSTKFIEPKKFINITNSQNFTIFTDIFSLVDDIHQSKLLNYNPKFIDIGTNGFGFIDNILENKKIKYFLDYCRDNSIVLTLRTNKVIYDNLEYFDVINIKGNESAGTNSNMSVREIFLEQKKATPNKLLCPSGGIATGEDIDWFLDHGAEAVSIGSAFSLTKECRMADEVKNIILNSSSEKLVKLNNNKLAYVIGDTINTDDDINLSKSLMNGIKNNGGHVYIGKAIDKINKLLTVEEFVSDLVANSKHLQCLV